jgi:hypothetical protein
VKDQMAPAGEAVRSAESPNPTHRQPLFHECAVLQRLDESHVLDHSGMDEAHLGFHRRHDHLAQVETWVATRGGPCCRRIVSANVHARSSNPGSRSAKSDENREDLLGT